MALKREPFNLERIGIKNVGAKEWFALIIAILLLTDLAIILNTPFLRQIIGFLFLTLLPGVLILQILKLNKLGFLEKFILTWGLSISFLMFFGLLINNLSLSLGYETPLSITSLFISLNLAFILLIIIGYKTNKDAFSFTTPDFNMNTTEKAFLIVPISFPALSIFGMNLMNASDNNIILMLLLFLIPIYVIFVCFFNHKFPKKLYPVVIFLISISLILLLPLRSNHLIGADVHSEYYYFRTTLDNFHWSAFGHSTLDACLAISLLPAIYQSILNIPSEFLYKILPSLIYSVSPLVIYVISKKYVEESYAFLVSCFFMFQTVFLWTEYNGRANIAMLFFAFAMLTLFNDKIDPLKKRILFIAFMASCMVSHYSTTYIFFFVMVGTFIGMEVLSKKYTFKKITSLTLVILFFALIFFWYSQVTEAAFDAGVGFIERTFKELNNFFIVESRGSGQALLGKDIMEKGIPHKIEFVLTWLTFVLIGIGVATLIRRYKEMSFPELGFKKPDFLKTKFEVEYIMIGLACAGLLVVVIALPFVAKGYGLGRMYPLAITILSVFFVIGGMILWKYLNRAFAFLQGKALTNLSFKKKPLLKKRKEGKDALQNPVRKSVGRENASEVRTYLIILLVLIPYFFCVTGVMYNMFGYPRQITLNSEGELYDALYVHDQESYSAKWLKNYMDQQNKIAVDYFGSNIFMSQAFSKGLTDSGALFKHKEIEGYIYLRYVNVVDGKLQEKGRQWHNLTDYSDVFIEKGKIYDNGGSEVYK
ncbi:MAG TPA: hypothetical protein C5S37_10000 [Methanophagales archaeon]|nr:hypothetical protein [Methanophagales archaeon]